MENYSIHWFRRDLRVFGNPSVQSCFSQTKGRVLCLFCFDESFLSRDDFSNNRFQLFLQTLGHLRETLKNMGGDLLFVGSDPLKAFEELFQKLKDQNLPLPTLFSWNRDYEPFARERDERVLSFLKTQGVTAQTHRDHLLIEPHELFQGKNPESGYQVFTPFSRKWFELFQSPEVQSRVDLQKKGLTKMSSYLKEGSSSKFFSMSWKDLWGDGSPFFEDQFESYFSKNLKKVTVKIPSSSPEDLLKSLKSFQKKIESYGSQRDFPSLDGTSRFSLFLKNGLLNIGQLIAFYKLQAPKKKERSGLEKFFTELVWREFYYHALYRNPWVEKKSFQQKYEGLKWENREDYFQAWKEGRTGYPIVDAGMRQLKETGWMHNRLRMIVASFLTKDLLIDWRWGEKYFMEELLDGDMAPNNGGWQWAASTGHDAQPYFRIFNPWRQSERFDPQGEYIKTYVPELSDVDTKELHRPILNHPSYPSPLVDHAEQREKALKLFKEV